MAWVPNPAGLKDQNGNVITVSRQNSLRPYPTLGAISNPLEQGFNSSYNSLQTSLTKRFSRGFQFNVNFTWMKSMDTTSCDGQFCNDGIANWGNGASQLRSGDRRLERAISVFDTPAILRYNYIWELPIGKGKTFLNRIPGWANYIVGNWKWSGVGSLTSGFPFQLYLGNNAGYPDDVSRIRVNTKSGVTNYILPGWKENCNNPVTQRCPYVDALNSFSPPSFMTIGSAARVVDYIRMPHVRTFDTSFLKEFPIHEQIKLAFRAELYGALNHVLLPIERQQLHGVPEPGLLQGRCSERNPGQRGTRLRGRRIEHWRPPQNPVGLEAVLLIWSDLSSPYEV